MLKILRLMQSEVWRLITVCLIVTYLSACTNVYKYSTTEPEKIYNRLNEIDAVKKYTITLEDGTISNTSSVEVVGNNLAWKDTGQMSRCEKPIEEILKIEINMPKRGLLKGALFGGCAGIFGGFYTAGLAQDERNPWDILGEGKDAAQGTVIFLGVLSASLLIGSVLGSYLETEVIIIGGENE